MPGRVKGKAMPGFLGGSDLAVPANSSNKALATDWMKDFTSTASEKALQAKGNIPNATNLLGSSVNERAASRSWFVPTAKHWVDVENGNVLRNMLAQILSGKLTVKQAASLRERQHRFGAQPVVTVAGDPLHGHRRRDATASRRRRRSRGRFLQAATPYLLIAPVVIVIAVILGYPLYWLGKLSTQRYGLFELIQHAGTSIGLDNYRSVLHDEIFWRTLLRTVIFTAVIVGLTMTIGMALALLLVRVSRPVRLLLSSGLILVWSMPVVVAVQVWYWMTNFQNGVVNHVLTQLHVGDYFQHDWYATTFSQLGMVSLLIIWGALPFVAITLYAGLAQVPADLVEAAEVDGARPWRVFVDITLPIIKPILLILDEPLDHLGLRRLHPAVPADPAVEDPRGQLPDEHLPLRRGLLQE